MEQFYSFLVDNWQWISIILIILLEIILLAVRSKVVSLPEGVLTTILELIIKAEKNFGAGHGSEKLSFVISETLKVFPSASPEVIKKYVEMVLTSPEKK